MRCENSSILLAYIWANPSHCGNLRSEPTDFYVILSLSCSLIFSCRLVAPETTVVPDRSWLSSHSEPLDAKGLNGAQGPAMPSGLECSSPLKGAAWSPSNKLMAERDIHLTTVNSTLMESLLKSANNSNTRAPFILGWNLEQCE